MSVNSAFLTTSGRQLPSTVVMLQSPGLTVCCRAGQYNDILLYAHMSNQVTIVWQDKEADDEGIHTDHNHHPLDCGSRKD